MVQKSVQWFDAHGLFSLALFLIVFIPLYPKIPLWSPIEQYIVRVRLEDFFVLFSALVFGLQATRKKAQWPKPMLWLMGAYAAIGLISTLVAIFVIQTVPLQFLHVAKTVLHDIRYLQYFSLFFIVFASIKQRKQAVIAVAVVALTVLGIVVYGYGQRYFYWPVYSTMNREFSKGIVLYLTENARVQSTFGGHYDMAAYLVITLPLLLACAYQVRRRWLSAALHTIFWLGMWLLILSASRTPFAATLVGILLVIFVSGLLEKDWLLRLRFWLTKGTIIALCTLVLSYYFGADMLERLGFALNSVPGIKAAIARLDQQRSAILPNETLGSWFLTPAGLQAMLPKRTSPPAQGKATEGGGDAASQIAQALPIVASSSDEPPTPVKPGEPTPSPTPGGTGQLPAGVYEDIPDVEVIATTSADGTVTYIKRQKPRVYSECALKQELSLCIRQEVLWPRALEGFLTNPLTGSGYATLTKASVDQFTEADSTDNNFLRTLGETGALGFITFYGTVLFVIWTAAKHVKSADHLVRALSIGLLCGTIGLLLNAVYIDVFAASKVAQSYWALAGLLFAVVAFDTTGEKIATNPANAVRKKRGKK